MRFFDQKCVFGEKGVGLSGYFRITCQGDWRTPKCDLRFLEDPLKPMFLQQNLIKAQVTERTVIRSLLRFSVLLLIAIEALSPSNLYADETIYTVVDVNPVPVKTPPPNYPNELKRLGIAGVVAVTIVIDEKGLVSSSKILKASSPEFEAPALEAINKWKFKPAKKDGVAVKMRVTVPMRFDLEE